MKKISLKKIELKKYFSLIIFFRETIGFFFHIKKRLKNIRNDKIKYIFFKLPESILNCSDPCILQIESNCESSISLNEFNGGIKIELKKGKNTLNIKRKEFLNEENVLSLKNNNSIKSITFLDRLSNSKKNDNKILELKLDEISDNYLKLAIKFLINSRINDKNNKYNGSFYSIYDYDNSCYRMSYWMWDKAILVKTFLSISNLASESEKIKLIKIADELANIFTKNQSKETEIAGCFFSRKRHYGKADNHFETLYGPNDTSFILYWAMIPIYLKTKNKLYLKTIEEATEWLSRCVEKFLVPPSHYYLERSTWEKTTFVDAGFTPQGLGEYCLKIDKKTKYIKSAENFILNFKNTFKTNSGFYIEPEFKKQTIFSRGQGWVLEGLISLYELTKNKKYLNESIELANLLCKFQNKNGSWDFSLLTYRKNGTFYRNKLRGECEKATTVITYHLYKLFLITNNNLYEKSATKAVKWCEKNMTVYGSNGIGGIFSRNISSGIVGLPFQKVATVYANAFYVLTKILMNKNEIR